MILLAHLDSEVGAGGPADGPRSPPRLHILTGGVCTGKTSLRRAQYANGWVVLDAAELFLILGGRELAFPSTLAEPLERFGQTLASTAVQARRDIVTEVIGDDAEALQSVIEALQRIGYEVAITTITCDVHEMLRRNAVRGADDISAQETQRHHLRWLMHAAVDVQPDQKALAGGSFPASAALPERLTPPPVRSWRDPLEPGEQALFPKLQGRSLAEFSAMAAQRQMAEMFPGPSPGFRLDVSVLVCGLLALIYALSFWNKGFISAAIAAGI